MGIRIINGGLMTTVQDAGRRGYQRFGMSVSGAVDMHSFIYANVLAGNAYDEAVIEATLAGPVIEFTQGTVIAVTGGDLSPSLNNRPLPMYQAVPVRKGSVLSFGAVRSGCRAYIAFAGGLDIPAVMGSRSTFIKAGIGGNQGRQLKAGDEIGFRAPTLSVRNLERRILNPVTFPGHYTVRVLMGPQDDRFTEEGINTFLNEEYTVTGRFDRMGCRLSGPKIAHVTDGNIITDGICFGSVQVPDEGEPIIMLSDRQTTGGYTKIAGVINADMPMIAQCKEGDTIRFQRTDISTAQDAYIAWKQKYRRLAETFDRELPNQMKREETRSADTGGPGMRYTLQINGQRFDVKIEENH